MCVEVLYKLYFRFYSKKCADRFFMHVASWIGLKKECILRLPWGMALTGIHAESMAEQFLDHKS